MQFNDHPDGYIAMGGSVYPLEFWALVEPDYAGLPEGIINRIFEAGVRHHLIDAGGAAVSGDINDAALSSYAAKKEAYDAAYLAHKRGANVLNDHGKIVIYEIESLTSDKDQIEADGAEKAIITCKVPDSLYVDEITWKVVAPNGTASSEVENMAAGIARLELTTTQMGTHTITASVAHYGRAETSIEGV